MDLGAPLVKFGLEVATDKTRILPFSRFRAKESGRRGGYFVKRRTSRKKLRASVANFTDWIRRKRHQKPRLVFATLRPKYQGYWNYYGVIGNFKSMDTFYYETKRILYKWLNRRSGRRSYTWSGLQQALDFFGIKGPRITERRAPS